MLFDFDYTKIFFRTDGASGVSAEIIQKENSLSQQAQQVAKTKSSDLAFQLGSSKHCSRNASLTDESEQSKEGNQSEICDLSSSNGS